MEVRKIFLDEENKQIDIAEKEIMNILTRDEITYFKKYSFCSRESPNTS